MSGIQDNLKLIRKNLVIIDSGKKKDGKAIEKVAQAIESLKVQLYSSASSDQQLQVSGVFNEFIPSLLKCLPRLEFEARKDVASIIHKLVRVQVQGKSPTTEYFMNNRGIIDDLFNGYEDPAVASNCGHILRGCITREELVESMLHSDNFFRLFDFIENPSFDIASDSFNTFKDLLTVHKSAVAEFLEENYDAVFERYANLLHSENYVTRRQSLKLLGELLLDKVNFNVMTRYISFSSNLKLMMTLLCDDSSNIQFEAFHVFKIFVANPNKPEVILDILTRNKSNLIDYLGQFHVDNEDEQFIDEKAYLIKQIQSL